MTSRIAGGRSSANSAFSVCMLRRDVDDREELVMFTLSDSLDAVKALAGEDYQRAVFYPKAKRFLIEGDLRAVHYEVVVAPPEDTPGARR